MSTILYFLLSVLFAIFSVRRVIRATLYVFAWTYSPLCVRVLLYCLLFVDDLDAYLLTLSSTLRDIRAYELAQHFLLLADDPSRSFDRESALSAAYTTIYRLSRIPVSRWH
jgi:hypothetical protein